jgi:hypothetical protein
MRAIEDNPSLLLSDSLQDNMSDFGIPAIQDRFILSTLSVLVNEIAEKVVGSVVAYTAGADECLLETKIFVGDAFSLLEVWTSVRLEKYELCLGENIIEFLGPFSVASIAIRDIDTTRQLCVLELKLRKV